jgi:hypothetical protein
MCIVIVDLRYYSTPNIIVHKIRIKKYTSINSPNLKSVLKAFTNIANKNPPNKRSTNIAQNIVMIIIIFYLISLIYKSSPLA